MSVCARVCVCAPVCVCVHMCACVCGVCVRRVVRERGVYVGVIVGARVCECTACQCVPAGLFPRVVRCAAKRGTAAAAKQRADLLVDEAKKFRRVASCQLAE